MSRDSQDLLESVEIFDVCELESELPCFCWVMGPIQCESGPIQCWGGYSVIDIGLGTRYQVRSQVDIRDLAPGTFLGYGVYSWAC